MILNENSTVLKYMYDYSSDVLGVKVKNDFIYHETVELEDGVYWILIKMMCQFL